MHVYKLLSAFFSTNLLLNPVFVMVDFDYLNEHYQNGIVRLTGIRWFPH